MKSSLFRCEKHGYFLHDVCPECGETLIVFSSAPYDPTDKNGALRRQVKFSL